MKYNFLKFIILSVIGVIVSNDVQAYDDERCSKENGRLYSYIGPFAVVPISLQSTFSTGECSLLGTNISDQQRLFVIENLEYLQKDSARGSGEYLYTLTHLYGLNEKQAIQFKRSLKLTYEKIFRNPKDLEFVFRAISSLALRSKNEEG